jgi:nickel-dependent lactate racemase
MIMVQIFKIPWASWYEPEELVMEFPDSWDIQLFDVKNVPEIKDEVEIRKILNNPIGSPTVSELANGKKNAVIVVDDISRHTKTEMILKVVLKELNHAGIKDENITLIVALGGHRPMTREDFIKKIGLSILERINVKNHHPFLNLKFLGESKLGTPIYVNQTYYESELKITIGGVIPHALAGFGGGAKIVLPGVCGIQTLEANHSASVRGAGVGLGYITELRKDIEDVCSRVGIDFSINIIPTIDGSPAGIFAGHFVKAHREAIKLLKKIYEIKLPPKTKFDVVFFNAYPEDTELSQSSKALNTYLLNPKLVSYRGAVVILSASTEGRGYHSLSGETGASLYKNPEEDIIFSTFGKRKILFYSPNVTQADMDHFYPKSVIFENDFKNIISKLEILFGENIKAGIIPTSIQLPKKID